MRTRPPAGPAEVSRRDFLGQAAVLAGGSIGSAVLPGCASAGRPGAAAGHRPYFQTRGVVLTVRDMTTYDWPALAAETGLNTLATHITPREIAAFVRTGPGERFLEGCRRHRLALEHELHALADLLPRESFATNPGMFRMNDQGERVADANLCVHSAAALETVAGNAVRYARLLPSTTGRYFYWIDDGQPMCRCPDCRGFSESDQALILENHVVRALRRLEPRATLAHLAYANTLDAPTQVKPEPGVFLEFAPIERRHDLPFAAREARGTGRGWLHGRMLDALDANLAWFGREGAQALEYWLDVSRFSGWNRDRTVEIPWHGDVFLDDLRTYGGRGIRHITTFAAWLDADYAARWGVAPVRAYGDGLSRFQGSVLTIDTTEGLLRGVSPHH